MPTPAPQLDTQNPGIAGGQNDATGGANDTDRSSGDQQQGQLAGPIETSDPLINSIQEAHPDGLTVVIYGPTTGEMAGGYKNDTNNRELTLQAKGMAEQKRSAAVNGDTPELGIALPALDRVGIQEQTKKVYDTIIARYKAAKPDNAPDEPETLKIKNLSLFYHGGDKELYLPGADLTTANTDEFVSALRYTMRNDIFVQLYACNAAKGEGSLSEVMAEELGGDANVFGHTTAAHTTENSNARVFGTLGDGTHMAQVMFPDSFVDAEVTRIWGESLPEGKRDAARAKVRQRLDRFYHRVFGLRGGWNDSDKEAFGDNAKVQESGYYANKGHRVPGREMFLDPEASAQRAQEMWFQQVPEELSQFSAIAPVSDAARNGSGGSTAAPENNTGNAPPANTGGTTDTDTGGGTTDTDTGGGAPEPVSINVSAAVNYNKTRPYSKSQWEDIQRTVGAGVDGDPGPNTAEKVAEWQRDNNLTVDGKVGPTTFREIQAAGDVSNETPPAAEGADPTTTEEDPTSDEVPSGNITANFSWAEFATNDGTPVPENLKQNAQNLAEQLEVIREAAGGASITVNSAYRHPEYNRRIGGASNSQHLYAKAADIVVGGQAPSRTHRMIKGLIDQGRITQGGLGKYNSFTHYDIRGTAARW